MLFNAGNRDLALAKDKRQKDYYVEHIEVLPATDDIEVSDIEKRFKEPLKDLKKVQKELNSISKEMKHRMREVRKNHGDELEYEKDMYKTRASVIDSKIKIADKKARITKDMLSMELKDKKFQKDASGIGSGSNNPDMRGHYASYFASDKGGMNTDVLSNPNKAGRGIKLPHDSKDSGYDPKREIKDDRKDSEPQRNKPKPQNKRQPKKMKRKDTSSLSDDDINSLEAQYGLNYQSSATNLKNKDKNLEEVIHVDPDKDVFWLEVVDEDGNRVENARKKHVDQMGEIEVDQDEDVVRDEFNNTYRYEIDSADHIPEIYAKQWREKGKLED